MVAFTRLGSGGLLWAGINGFLFLFLDGCCWWFEDDLTALGGCEVLVWEERRMELCNQHLGLRSWGMQTVPKRGFLEASIGNVRLLYVCLVTSTWTQDT